MVISAANGKPGAFDRFQIQRQENTTCKAPAAEPSRADLSFPAERSCVWPSSLLSLLYHPKNITHTEFFSWICYFPIHGFCCPPSRCSWLLVWSQNWSRNWLCFLPKAPQWANERLWGLEALQNATKMNITNSTIIWWTVDYSDLVQGH